MPKGELTVIRYTPTRHVKINLYYGDNTHQRFAIVTTDINKGYMHRRRSPCSGSHKSKRNTDVEMAEVSTLAAKQQKRLSLKRKSKAG